MRYSDTIKAEHFHPIVEQFLLENYGLSSGPTGDNIQEGVLYPSPERWRIFNSIFSKQEIWNEDELTVTVKEHLGMHAAIMFPKFYEDVKSA